MSKLPDSDIEITMWTSYNINRERKSSCFGEILPKTGLKSCMPGAKCV